MTDEQWVSVSEAAELYQLDSSHVRWLLRKERITGRKSGGIWLVLLPSLEDYQRRMKELGKGKHGLRHYKSS